MEGERKKSPKYNFITKFLFEKMFSSLFVTNLHNVTHIALTNLEKKN